MTFPFRYTVDYDSGRYSITHVTPMDMNGRGCGITGGAGGAARPDGSASALVRTVAAVR
jgi:hypothetical protein